MSGLADDNQVESPSNSESENETTKGDTVKKSPTMDDTTQSPVDDVNQTTEVNEQPNETVDEVKEKPDSEPEPEVKGKIKIE